MVTVNRDFDPLHDRRPEDVDVRLAIAITWRDFNGSVRNEVLDELAGAASESFPDPSLIHLRVSAYKVGPEAEGPTVQMLFTAYENIRPIADELAAWLAIGAFAKEAIKRVRSRLRRLISEHGAEVEGYREIYLNDEIVVSQPLVQGLCFKHYHETHGDHQDRISMDVSSRTPYQGIVWAGRPDSSVIYTVRIWTGQTSYIYIVDGRGKPIEHFSIRGREFTQLAMPDWYGGHW